MTQLEEKIRKNRDAFDIHEPEDGHLQLFQEKLAQQGQEGVIRHNWFLRNSWKFAAAVVLLMAVSVLLVELSRGPVLTPDPMANQLPEELQEAQFYYQQLAEGKIASIKTLAENEEQANQVETMALEEVNRLNEHSQELEQEYMQSNQDQRVFDALLNNYRMLSGVLDQMLTEMQNQQALRKASDKKKITQQEIQVERLFS